MAVATPILERKIEETREEVRYDYASRQSADEIHNSQIKERYAQLINPETRLSDLKQASEMQAASVRDVAPAENNVPAQIEAPDSNEVYLVNNARADSDIFRADSFINRRVATAPSVEVEADVTKYFVGDEGNEDLMPTRTTMQYNTLVKRKDEEGTIANTGAEKRISLTKRDKIIVAVVVTVIVALFALIIINSAIISGVNSDLGSLQSSLNSARAAYYSVTDQITDYQANFDETLKSFAESLGMFK